MPTPRARATTRHRQAEHTVVRAESMTAATTACQVTARSPSLTAPAPICRPRNHRTVTPAARRSNDGPKRRTAGPIPAGTECRNATRVTRPGRAHSSAAGCGNMPAAVNQRDLGPVVPIKDLRRWLPHGGVVHTIQPADESTPPATRLPGKDAPTTIRLAPALR